MDQHQILKSIEGRSTAYYIDMKIRPQTSGNGAAEQRAGESSYREKHVSVSNQSPGSEGVLRPMIANSAEKSDVLQLRQLQIEDQTESNNRGSFHQASKNQASESADEEVMRPSILGIS